MAFWDNIFGERIPITFRLVKEGDIDGLKNLGHINVNEVYDYYPLLLYATSHCKRNLYSVVEFLISAGCNVEARDMYEDIQYTPLIEICGTRSVNTSVSVDVAHLLLKNGARVNARSKQGESAIHKTAFTLSIDMVNLLLQYKADINLADWNGNTVLHSLQYLSDFDVEEYGTQINKYIEHLIQCGARFNLANRQGAYPGQYIIPQNEKICKILRRYLERSRT